MQRLLNSALAAVLAASAFTAELSAQVTTPPPRRGPPTGVATGPRYDASTVVTVKGTLLAVDTSASMSGIPGLGLHVTLKTATDVFPVHLGPIEYLAKQKVRLVKGDAVTVTGSRIQFNTVPTILAASVVKGADTLALRDAAGIPRWRGTRIRAPGKF